MQRILTPDELKAKLGELRAANSPEIIQSMEQASANVEGTAKRYCTPGHSPYEGLIFPTKKAYADMHDHTYTGAPYSYDDDPNRLLNHMRDQIDHEVIADGDTLHGIVGVRGSAPGEPWEYAWYVHIGNFMAYPRPVIPDAVRAEQEKTLKIISEGVSAHLRRVCES